MKVLDAIFAKDFSNDTLSRDFSRTYSKLKALIDERELEMTVKVISVKSSQGRIMEELLSQGRSSPRDKFSMIKPSLDCIGGYSSAPG